MAERRWPMDGQWTNLTLGKSFDSDEKVAFHSVRYDFKPASIDTSQKASIEIGEGNSVTVTVPHVEGSGNKETVFKGNKKPATKECVLIINNKTGEITLERLSYSMQLKSTRTKGIQNHGAKPYKIPSPNESVASVESKLSEVSQVKTAPPPPLPPPPAAAVPIAVPQNFKPLSESFVAKKNDQTNLSTLSDNLSSEPSDSDSDSSEEEEEDMVTSPNEQAPNFNTSVPFSSLVPQVVQETHVALLHEDLQLSESSSDESD